MHLRFSRMSMLSMWSMSVELLELLVW